MIDHIGNEGPKPQETVLDKLNSLLNSSESMKNLYDLMNINTHVIEAGLKPNPQQFKKYFEQLRIGFEWLKNNFGIEALPANMKIYNGVVETGNLIDKDFVVYIPEADELGVSFLHIAGQSSRYNSPNLIFIDNHLPEGFGVKGEDHTVLQAIEEGYHRYQHKVLKIEYSVSARDIGHLIEAQVIPIYGKAIKDLNISLTPLNNLSPIKK